MATLIDGKALREELLETEFRPKVDEIKEQYGTVPHLVTILVGENPASKVYVNNKIKLAERVGLKGTLLHLPGDISLEELKKTIQEKNEDPDVTGILLQLPLPEHLRPHETEAINLIDFKKDVDGLTTVNQGLLFTGRKGITPCTPYGILRMLKKYEIPIKGKEAVVMGRSILVGKPMGMLLLKEHATVTYVHSRTQNLDKHTRRADILIAAVGKAEFVKEDMVKEGSVIIDVGINRNAEGKLVGDVDFDSVSKKASFITPVPGGVGPMTVAMLMNNTIEAFYLQHEK